jgi:hypothetical protein
MAQLLRPNDLADIASRADREKRDQQTELKRRREEKALELRDAFMSREIRPDAVDRINKAVRIAAEQGLHRVEVVTFPCKYCNDGGRRINNLDPEWPTSLEGFAKRAYDFYDRELKPLGFKAHAEVVSYREGRPGDITLFLKW